MGCSTSKSASIRRDIEIKADLVQRERDRKSDPAQAIERESDPVRQDREVKSDPVRQGIDHESDPIQDIQREPDPVRQVIDSKSGSHDAKQDILHEKPPVFLHGALQVTIHNVENLDLPDEICKKGVYVQVSLGKAIIGETRSVATEKNPGWSEAFRHDVAHEANDLCIEVFCGSDEEMENLGSVKISCADMIENPNDPTTWGFCTVGNYERPEICQFNSFPLGDARGCLTEAKIHVTICFQPTSTLTLSEDVITKHEVTDSYFSLQKQNHVTLYQDADTPHVPLYNQIKYGDGSSYQPASCFKDIYRAITEAKKIIYLLDWSMWVNLVLVRDNNDEEVTLGNLLKKKADQGVTVLGMVWDEKVFGLAGTHDEETGDYFKNTNVDIFLIPRTKDKLTRILKNMVHSHHQKAIVCDADHPHYPDKRRLVAFVGSIDMTKGRYDTPDHPLYATLSGVHKTDFFNPILEEASPATGPRLPWHEVHSKIEGPAAYDVARNFEERWNKQAPDAHRDKLVDLADGEFDLACPGPGDESSLWQCQIFRSITEDAAKFTEGSSELLNKRKNIVFDDSIQRAYVHQIRQANKFLYIENQYFVGSSYAWESDDDVNANHIIPMEIANKIVEKIHASERFAVYIIIPLHPDGNPTSLGIQEILQWQYRTIAMIYNRIEKAIKETGIEATPKDYLNFFCLAKREKDNPPGELKEPENPTLQMFRKTRRFPVHVHSKMMIIDDTYILVGSANMNQRSMDGARDTEIVLGAFQDNYVCANGVLPQGQVSAYRKALWAEHTGRVHDVYNDPSQLDCVKTINKIAQKNWDLYAADETNDTEGHLLAYPLSVTIDGKVQPLKHHKVFPDTQASVVGKAIPIIPATITGLATA